MQRNARIHIDAISSFWDRTSLKSPGALHDNPAEDLLAQLCLQAQFIRTVLTAFGCPLDGQGQRDMEQMIKAIAESAALVYSCTSLFEGKQSVLLLLRVTYSPNSQVSLTLPSSRGHRKSLATSIRDCSWSSFNAVRSWYQDGGESRSLPYPLRRNF